LEPCVQFRPKSVDRTHPVMQVSVNGHPLPLFPSLHRRHVASEVYRYFLPRIHPVIDRSLGTWRDWDGFTHRILRTDARFAAGK
jgi:hypothetical protein